MKKSIYEVFTDGACSGNPGPGGWACVIRDFGSGEETELVGGWAETTNNQMELQALIAALTWLPPRSHARVTTDSVYVAKGCQEWIKTWKANGWRRKEGKGWKPVKNLALWQQLDELLSAHEVTFSLVRGHSGHKENERCDFLATRQAAQYRPVESTPKRRSRPPKTNSP